MKTKRILWHFHSIVRIFYNDNAFMHYYIILKYQVLNKPLLSSTNSFIVLFYLFYCCFLSKIGLFKTVQNSRIIQQLNMNSFQIHKTDKTEFDWKRLLSKRSKENSLKASGLTNYLQNIWIRKIWVLGRIPFRYLNSLKYIYSATVRRQDPFSCYYVSFGVLCPLSYR